jgi:hypothetical protein
VLQKRNGWRLEPFYSGGVKPGIAVHLDVFPYVSCKVTSSSTGANFHNGRALGFELTVLKRRKVISENTLFLRKIKGSVDK